MASNKSRAFFSNSGWMMAQQIYSMLLSLVVGALSARYLGPSNYGLINYGASIISFFTIISRLGMDSVIINEMLKAPEKQGTYLGSALVLRLLTSIASVFMVMGIIRVIEPGNIELYIVTLLQSIAIIMQTYEVLTYWFQMELKMKFVSIATMIALTVVAVEKYLGTESGELPVDYKFYCMNGKASSVMVCVDRKDGQHPKFFFLDRKWNKLPYTKERFLYPDLVIEKPKMIDQAFDLAEKLSKNFPFVRVDLYIIGEKIYFGELTFTPAAGLDSDFKFVPPGGKEDADTMLGKLLTLPKN